MAGNLVISRERLRKLNNAGENRSAQATPAEQKPANASGRASISRQSLTPINQPAAQSKPSVPALAIANPVMPAQVQTPELDKAQEKNTFGSALLSLIGRGTDQALSSDEGRALMQTGAEAIKKPEVNQWSGRQDLVDEYKKLEREEQAARMTIANGGLLPEGYLENTANRMNEVRQTLEKGDEAAGNGPMSYSGQSRAANLLAGAGQNIASSLTSAAGTAGEAVGRGQLMEQTQNVDQAVRDYRFGEDRERLSQETEKANAASHEAWSKVTAAADRLGEGAAKDLEAAKGGLTKLGQAGIDIAENLIEMGFDAAVGAATGGSSLIPMFARTFGSAAQEARRDGATLDEQVLYGTVKGGIEVLTEKMFDGVANIYGKGAADELVEKAIGKLAKTDTGRTFLRLLSNSAGEGVEELVSGLLEPLAQAIYRDDIAGINFSTFGLGDQALTAEEARELMQNGQNPGYLSNIDPSELLYSALMGAAVGAIGGAGSIVTGQNAAANRALREAETANVQAQTNAAQPETAPVQETAPQAAEAQAAQTEQTAPEMQQEVAPAEEQAPAQETQPATPLAQTLMGGQETEAAELTADERNEIIDKIESLTRFADQLRIRGDAESRASVLEQIAELQRQLNGGQAVQEAPAQQAPAENAGVQNPVGSLNQRPTGSAPQRGTAESQTPTTVQNSPVTTEEMSQLIDQNREVGGYRYIPITNDATTQAAAERIQRNGWEGTLRAWSNDVHAGKTGAQLAATGALLYNNAVNSGNTSLALNILSDYTMLGRNTARGLQAMKIIQSLTPDARLYMIEKQVDQLSETLKNVPDGITIPQELKDAYRAAETEEARDQIVTQMQQAVADQIPRTIGGFFTSLRYLNMLGNFRTQARNLIGNTLMAATTSAKNGVMYLLEGIASRATNGRYERSISLRVDPELRQAAMEEFRENPDFISGESRYADNRSAADSFMQGVRDAQESFGSRNPLVNTLLAPLRGYNRATRFATEAGDRIFIGPRYARSLAGYLQANGMDAATFRGIRDGSITLTAEQSAMLERARDFAMREAQEATFHDSNQLSDWVSKIGRKPGTPSWARVLSEGLLPFRKTPANVAVRMFEYSPLGAIDTAIEAYRAGQADSDVDMNDVLNSAAKSLTGTGIFVLGMLMRAAGRLRGHEDDDKQSAFDQMRGQQDYSYITKDGDSYTLDWASPIAGTLFMGSQLYDLIQEGGFKLDDIGEIVTRMSDPMIQMSMLQGVKDTLDTLSNSDNSLGDVAVNLALSYLSQAVSNSLLRQGERTYEDRRYSTFTTSDTRFGRTMQRQFGKWTTSVPRYDYNQVEYIDAWGRPDYNGSPLARGFENFLSPGYIGRNNSTEVDNELQRLYNAGQSNVFPQRIPVSYEVSQYDADGNRTGSRPLTPDEYVTFQRIAGQTSLEMVNDLMDSDVYQNMTDEARAAAISDIYMYAKNMAAKEVEPSTKDTYGDVSTLSNIGAYFGTYAAFGEATSNKNHRDYEAVDELMDTYGELPDDVRALLEEKRPELANVYDASLSGIDSRTYFDTKDTLKDLKPASGYDSPPTWQKAVFLASGSNLTPEQQDYFAGLNFTDSGDRQISVYDQYGDKSGERDLTEEEYAAYKKQVGETSMSILRDLMGTEAYRNMSDEVRADTISEIAKYARQQAAISVEPSTKDTYEGVSELSDIGAYFSTSEAFSAATSNDHRRDYAVVDGLMKNYDSLPEDVKAMLAKKKPELAKVYAASEAGINSQTYYTVTDTAENLTPPAGYKAPPTWQQVESVMADRNLSQAQQDYFAGLYLTHGQNGKMSTYEKYMAARKANYRPKDIAAFYRIYTVTKGDDKNGDGRADNGTTKNNIVAEAMRYGFSEKQANQLYNMFKNGRWS